MTRAIDLSDDACMAIARLGLEAIVRRAVREGRGVVVRAEDTGEVITAWVEPKDVGKARVRGDDGRWWEVLQAIPVPEREDR